MTTHQPSSLEMTYGDDRKDNDQFLEVKEPSVGLGEMHFGHMSPEERAAAMKLAREIDPGPSLGSLRHIQFLLSAAVVIVCSCDTGFDSTIMSSVNSMTQFQSYFGLTSASKGTGVLFVSNLA